MTRGATRGEKENCHGIIPSSQDEEIASPKGWSPRASEMMPTNTSVETDLLPFKGDEATEEALAHAARSCVALLRNKDDWERQATGLQLMQRLAVFSPETLAADPSLYKTLLGWVVRSVSSLRSALSKRAAQTLSELFARLGPKLNAPLTDLLIPALMKRASDNTSGFIRQHARAALHSFCTKCGSRDVVRQLVIFIQSSNASLREIALLAIHDCLAASDQNHVHRDTLNDDAMRAVLQDPNPRVRKAAAQVQNLLANGGYKSNDTPSALLDASESRRLDGASLSARTSTRGTKPSFLPVLNNHRRVPDPSLTSDMSGPRVEAAPELPALGLPSKPSSPHRRGRTRGSPERSRTRGSPSRSRRMPSSPSKPEPATRIPSLQTNDLADQNNISMETWRRRRATKLRQPTRRQTRVASSPTHSRASRLRPRRPQTQAPSKMTSPSPTTHVHAEQERPIIEPIERVHEDKQDVHSERGVRTTNDFASTDRDGMAPYQFDYGVVDGSAEVSAHVPRPAPQNSVHRAVEAAVRPVTLRGIVTPEHVQRARDASDDIWAPVPETEEPSYGGARSAKGHERANVDDSSTWQQTEQQEVALWQEIAGLDQRLAAVRTRARLRQARIKTGIDAMPADLGLSPAGAAIYANAVAEAPAYDVSTDRSKVLSLPKLPKKIGAETHVRHQGRGHWKPA